MFGDEDTPAVEGHSATLPDEPLATGLGPRALAKFVGQDRLLAPGIGAAQRDRGRASALDDPARAPGSGKSTLALPVPEESGRAEAVTAEA